MEGNDDRAPERPAAAETVPAADPKSSRHPQVDGPANPGMNQASASPSTGSHDSSRAKMAAHPRDHRQRRCGGRVFPVSHGGNHAQHGFHR